MDEIRYKRLSKIVLGALLAISALCAVLASQLGFDYDFENFFPQDDPETEFFRSYRHHFESDNDFVIVAIDRQQGIFESDFIERVDSLVTVLESLPNVDTVITPTRMTMPMRDPFIGTLFEKPLLR
ncbi:MAG: hypothetical protein RL226_2417, partial [Bacteroidota bacterium]